MQRGANLRRVASLRLGSMRRIATVRFDSLRRVASPSGGSCGGAVRRCCCGTVWRQLRRLAHRRRCLGLRRAG